jgi:hypothetical protein
MAAMPYDIPRPPTISLLHTPVSTAESHTDCKSTQLEDDLIKLKDFTELLTLILHNDVPAQRSDAETNLTKLQDSSQSLLFTSPPPPSDFLIVSDFPEIFAELGRQRFSLLWRGNRDGFGASDFHNHCDGDANTLTVILDTDGNIFGAFSPVDWQPPAKSRYKADPSLTNFLFLLKNPDKVHARRFALNAEEKRW